jgi:growth arrest-specific protein 8
MMNHESAFREMKEYYNDITRENLEIIKLLKEKYTDIKAQIAQNESTVLELKKGVKDMLAPLS